MPDDWTSPLTTGSLLAIAAAAVAVLLTLIIWARLHAFLSLVLVSLLTAFAAGIPPGSIVDVLLDGFGGTLAAVGLLVAAGAMLGRLIETSGGARELARVFVDRFGEDRAPFALGVASLLFGFPIFADAALVIMLPVIFSVARRVGGSVLLYALPAAGAFSVVNIFVPPTPGPVAAADIIGVNPGVVILVGLVVAVPTWYFSSYLYGLWAGRRIEVPVPAIFGEVDDDEVDNPPSIWIIIGLLLLPLALITLNTGLSTWVTATGQSEEATWVQVCLVLGSTPIALLITVLTATLILGHRRGADKSALEKTLDSALGPVASVVLITGAGGMFGGVLQASGIGNALSETLDRAGLPVIVAGFIIAAGLRVAQGSATVALITAAGLVAPAVAAGGFNQAQQAAIVLAIGGGAAVLSHVNDSGFWLASRLLDMSVSTTLKTWTVVQTLLGVIGFGVAVVIFTVA